MKVAHTSIWRISAALGFLVFAAACKDRKAAVVDSSLSKDLALAQSNAIAPTVFNDAPIGGSARTSPARRAPSPRPEPPRANAPVRRPTPRPNNTPAPIAQTPTPTPPQPVATLPAPVPAPAAGIIGTGARVGMATTSRACINTLLPGDKLTATVTNGVDGTNGASIPPGATVVLEVAAINRADPIESTRIDFRVRSVEVNGEPYPVTGDVATLGPMEKISESSGNDKTKVIGGAVAGAVLGKIFGHSTKATVIGAAAGAAAGAGAAQTTRSSNACLPSGSALGLTFSRDVVVRHAE